MKKTILILAIVSLLVLTACNQQTTNQSTEEAPTTSAPVEFRDFGPEPFVLDIEAYTLQNEKYRQSIWTGTYMQMTVMNILPGEDIGLEMHPDIDQFIRVEAGSGIVRMGDSEDNLNFEKRVEDDFAVFVPAGKWHNLVNDSDKPLKIYSIYAPVEHPHGTVHATQEEGFEAHDH
ncbi:MAG: cupin domain-containing protein [Bacteroidia bacterium]|nr:cupin domain-containing protein [Bacteroidia bacterium]